MRNILKLLTATLALFATPALAESSVTAVDGIRYQLLNSEYIPTTILEPGDVRYVGLQCVTHKVDWYYQTAVCSWQQKVVATKTEVRLEPAGTVTKEPEMRGDLYLFLLIPGIVLVGLFLGSNSPNRKNGPSRRIIMSISVLFSGIFSAAYYSGHAYLQAILMTIATVAGLVATIYAYDRWYRYAAVAQVAFVVGAFLTVM